MNNLELILITTLALALTYLVYPYFSRLLIAGGLVTKNYLGEPIPTAYGSCLVINYLFILLVGAYFNIYSAELLKSCLFFLLVVGIVGLVDDYLGDGENKGLSGHFRESLFGNRVTTGFLKALSISLFALLMVIKWSQGIFWSGVDFLLIVLMANFINLLDLRPGRAWKGFLLLFLVLAPLAEAIFFKLLIPILAMAIVLLPIDLQGEAMLGDVGANFLGSILGLSLLWALPAIYKLLLVGGLISIHLYTERVSLTEVIAANRFLAYLDAWGRK
ncbi:hypothetical protein [Fuchsiella alkaliacetigena]|uniref:hypothetical protein n=1 Tax=Fuchsiella alkaliacetigena TaxID=957042 RepID=UPI00200ABC77|nr:hypothetical protein [Fuchsiella alkaliacetigena]